MLLCVSFFITIPIFFLIVRYYKENITKRKFSNNSLNIFASNRNSPEGYRKMYDVFSFCSYFKYQQKQNVLGCFSVMHLLVVCLSLCMMQVRFQIV